MALPSYVEEYILPLLCALIASWFGYFFTCQYADVSRALQSNYLRLKLPSNSYASNSNNSKVTFADQRVDEDKKNSSRCSLKVVWLGFVGLIYISLELYALSKLNIAVVIPISMMFFVWSSIYRMWKKGFDSRFFCLIISIVVLVALAVYSGSGTSIDKTLVTVVDWNERTIIYMLCFLLAVLLIYLARKSTKVTYTLAKYFFCGVQTRDMVTVLETTLAGLVGGQSVVMVKMFAEIIEQATRNGDKSVFEDPGTYVVLALAITFVLIHSLFFNMALSNLESKNAALLMPSYRFVFMTSAGIASSAYLTELTYENVGILVLYSLSMLALLGICLTLVYFAIKGPLAERLNRKRAVSRMINSNRAKGIKTKGGSDLNELALGDDLEKGKSSEIRSAEPLLSETGGKGIWSVGVSDSDIYVDEDDELFFMCRDRTPSRTEHSLNKRRSSSVYSKQYTEEPSVSEAKIDYAYPDSEDTMVVKQGLPNKHADGIKSSWVDPGDQVGQWNVRGPNYLVDRVKIPSFPTRMKVASIDWLPFPKKSIECVSKLKYGYVQKQHAGRKDRPFMFVVNFMVPTVGNYVNYFVSREGICDPVFDKMVKEFCEAEDDSYRDERFKLIPGVLQGSYVVRKTVGNTPAIIGKKLDVKYFKGDNWFEVSIDVGSSRIARSIMGAVKGYASGLVLHMAYLIESKTKEELPERILGGVDLYFPVMGPRGKVELSEELIDESASINEPDTRNGGGTNSQEQVPEEDSDSVSLPDNDGYQSC